MQAERKYEVWGSSGANTVLTTSADGYAASTGSVNYCVTPEWYYYNWYYPVYHPIAMPCDRVSNAFKIAKMLQEEKLVVLRTVKQFTDLVDKLVVVL